MSMHAANSNRPLAPLPTTNLPASRAPTRAPSGVSVPKGPGLNKNYTVGGPGSDVVVTTTPQICTTSFTVTTTKGCYRTHTINLNVAVRRG
jgi:hypothetical protein